MAATKNSPKEIVWAVQESALGTMMTSPVAGTNSLYPRLSDGMFDMNAEPMIEFIAQGGGYDLAADVASDHYACKGKLKTKLYPSQFAFWVQLLGERVSLDQLSPFTTTELPGDLASLSLYHAVRPGDSATYVVERFSGAKIVSGTIAVSRQSTVATLELDFLACRSYPNAMDASAAPSDFVFPADTDYPVDPFTFRETAGYLTVGSTLTQYESVSLSVKNKLDGRWWENAYLSTLEFCGREVTLDAELFFKSGTDKRAVMQALTATSASFAFHRGADSYGVNLKGKNRITQNPYNLPLGQAFTKKLSLRNVYDNSVGDDLSFTHP